MFLKSLKHSTQLNICVAALYERMRADQRKFGKSAWAAAVDRMERLQYSVSKETLQLMRAKEICLEQRKHGLKEEVNHNTTPTGLSLTQTSAGPRKTFSHLLENLPNNSERQQHSNMDPLTER